MKHKKAVGETITYFLGSTQIEKNRYYVRSTEVIQFLSVNELPLRESNESCHSIQDEHLKFSAGLFLKFNEYTLAKDLKLPNIAKNIPKNGRYTLKDIQNKVIDVLASLVLQEVKHRYEYEQTNTSCFCIKSDGTRNI